MGKVPNSSPLLGFGIGLLVALLDWGNVPVPDWILYGAIAMAILLILAGVPSWARWLYSLVRKFRIRAPIYRLPLPSAPAIMIGNSDLERRIIRSLWRNSYFIRKAKDSPENLFHVGAYHPGEGGSLGPVVNIVQTVDAPVIVTLSTGFTLAEGPRDRFLAFADADKAGCRRMLAKALAALPNILWGTNIASGPRFRFGLGFGAPQQQVSGTSSWFSDASMDGSVLIVGVST